MRPTVGAPEGAPSAIEPLDVGIRPHRSSALQGGLEQLAKPWWRAQSMRVFRDRTALPAGDDTWLALRERLGRSRWLVLLASPDAAASPWVALEVEWWRTYHSVGGTIKKLIIVRTAGDLRWTGTDVDWAATTCLPEEALGGAFKEEQTWAELPRTGGTPYPRLLPLALGGGYVPGYGERMVPTTRRRRPSCVRRSST